VRERTGKKDRIGTKKEEREEESRFERREDEGGFLISLLP
jgi:hypothetical protein